MSSFQRLLAPVDFTDKNISALETAAVLARTHSGTLIVLHVIETIDESASDAEVQKFYHELETEARRKMDEMLNRFASQGFAIEKQIVFGKRGPEVIRYAMEQQIDLLVLSSHRVDAQRPEASWGSLSYQMATAAPCPVLLVK